MNHRGSFPRRPRRGPPAPSRNEGRTVIYDTNHRPRLWASLDAPALHSRALACSTIALPSSEDLEGIFGAQDGSWRQFLESFAIPEIIVKNGSDPLDVYCDGRWTAVPLTPAEIVVDTTAAGDSFNAGFLAARLHGKPIELSVLLGHDLACTVIGHAGAIIDRNSMPEDTIRKVGL